MMTEGIEGIEDGIRVLSHAEVRALLAKSFERDAPESRTAPPCVRIDILDKTVVKELDPLLLDGEIVPCWSTLDATAIVHVSGIEAFSATPMPPGTTPTGNVSLDVYEARVADPDHGVDDTGETSADWIPQGLAAAREVLVDAPPGHGMPGFKQEREVRRRQAESVARWYGVAPADIAQVSGRPYEARRSMLKPCGKATSLALALAKAKAEDERAAEAARIAFEEERRPNSKTLADLGLAGVAVPLGDLEVQVPPCLVNAGLSPVWIDAAGVHYFVWRAIEGLPLPSAEFAGCRTLRPDETIPASPARRLEDGRDASNEIYSLTVRLRRKFLPDIDRGPVSTWSTEGLEAAKETAAKYADFFYRPRHAMGWVVAHTMELIVRRGIRPDLAAAIVWSACLDVHSRMTGEPRQVPRTLKRKVGAVGAEDNLRPRMNPEKGTADLVVDSEWTPPSYPSDRGAVQKKTIEKLAAEAAASGEVEPGCLVHIRVQSPSPGKRRSHGATFEHAKS